MKSSTKVLLIASVAGLLLVRCNKTPNVHVNADGSMKVDTTEGSVQTGTSVPKDWPSDVAQYPNSTVQFSGSATPQTGKIGWAMVLVTSDTAADVKSFYEKSFAENGWAIVANMESQGTVIMGATKGDRAVSLTAGVAEGQTSITLGVSTQK